MKRIFFLLCFIIVFSAGWLYVKDTEYGNKIETLYSIVKEDVQDLLESDELKELVASIQALFDEETLEDSALFTEPKSEVKTNIPPPSEQTFSIHGMELGMTRLEVEALVGDPQDVSMNEYGLNWYTYHQQYKNFVKVMYNQDEEVVGLYTNQDLIQSAKPIRLGTPRESISQELGSPLTKIQKGYIFYEFPKDADFEVYLMDDSYLTFFYDVHENNTVTSLQIIARDIEDTKKTFYTTGSEALKEGFEQQMFDLTNAIRVRHGLTILTWDEKARQTARKHSADMAEKEYFDHTNLEGLSPFDRMEEDQITFTMAGENLAYGQFSSIFAHEGLMNSLGHRENILKEEFQYLGVGVAFNEESHPYYTQNYFTN